MSLRRGGLSEAVGVFQYWPSYCDEILHAFKVQTRQATAMKLHKVIARAPRMVSGPVQ